MFTNIKTAELNQKNLTTKFSSPKRTTTVERITTLAKKEDKTEIIKSNYEITSNLTNDIQALIDKFESTGYNNTFKSSTTPFESYPNNNTLNSFMKSTSTSRPNNLRTSTLYNRPSFKTISYQPNSEKNFDSFYNNTWNKPPTKQEVKQRNSIQFPKNFFGQRKSRAGVLYIIHHDEFKKSWIPFKKQIPFREGSKRDVESLEKAFGKFNLKIKKHENLKKEDIKKLMNQIEIENFGDNSCVVFAILSHGDRNNMIYSFDGKKYSIFDSIIFNLINNKTLKGKPKIFIVQACKGPSIVDPRFLQTDCSKNAKGVPDELLILFASTEGFVSYRNSITGSPLIQEFCLEFEQNGKSTDIQTIMSTTTKRVIDITKNNQIPCPSGYLTTPYVFGHYM